MPDVIHEESGIRSIVPGDYDAEFILAEAGYPNHAGWASNEDGTKVIAYHPNDHEAVIAVIDDYEARYVEKVAKPRLWDEVKALRDAKETAPAVTPLGLADSDERSKTKVLGLVLMALLAKQSGAPFAEEFTMADNTIVMLDADQAILLGMSLGQNVSQIHARGRVLRAEIEAASSFADLAAIDITLGWP